MAPLFQQPFMSGGFPSMNRGLTPGGPFSDDTGLKAYWKFNETSGNIINVSESAADLGSAADITVTGATYNQSMSPFGYSLQFDGVNDEVQCGSSTSQWNFMHNTTFEFSLCWWQIRSAWDSTQEALWGNCDEWASSETGFSCRYPTTDGRLDFNWSNGTNMNRWRPTQTGFTQDANPHFICITADYSDATNNLEVWQDGVSLGTHDKDGSTQSNGNSLDAVHIGSQYDANNSYFGGNIAEMSVWSRRLTDAEIGELYNSGAGVNIY